MAQGELDQRVQALEEQMGRLMKAHNEHTHTENTAAEYAQNATTAAPGAAYQVKE